MSLEAWGDEGDRVPEGYVTEERADEMVAEAMQELREKLIAAEATLTAQAAEVERLRGELELFAAVRAESIDRREKLEFAEALALRVTGRAEELEAEVDRLTGMLAAAQSMLNDAVQKMIAATDRATTAESSLETARGALEKMKLAADALRNHVPGYHDNDAKHERIHAAFAQHDAAITAALAALPSPPITKINGEG